MDTKTLRQKILDLAIRGKLVPQDPNDEPASVLLERIRAQKQQMVREGKLKSKDIKDDTVIFVGEDNLHYEKFADGSVKCIEDKIPFNLPENWAWVRLQSFCTMSNGTAKRNGADGTHTTVLRLADLGEDDIFYSGTRSVILTDEEIAKYSLSDGDILFIRVNGSKENVGKSYFFEGQPFPVAYCDHLIRCTPSTVLRGKLLSMFMRCGYVRQLIGERMVSAAGQNTISQPSLGTILLPIPPHHEQDRILQKLTLAEGFIEQLCEAKHELVKITERAKAKILDLAIHGQLVPQDPADEPASVLLDRIRKEKENLIKQGKIKRDKKETIIFRGDDNSYYRRSPDGLEDITDDLPYDIPDSWEWTSISELFSINPRNKIAEDMVVSFIPMPLIDDGYSGCHRSETKEWKSIKTGFSHFQNGDIGIAKITPCFENRKSVIFRDLCNGYGAGTTELHILRPQYRDCVLPEYALALLKSERFIQSGVQAFTGAVGQQRIGKDYVMNTYFPLPPYAEQRRIIDRINKLFTLIATIESAL